MDKRLITLETKWRTVIPTLATKADLSDLEGRLRAEMHKGFGEMQRWVIGTTLASVAAFVSVVALILSVLRAGWSGG
ncbi:hypothetical protein [Roseateles amylovorans]|uniref:DUF1640 domain-containing protein n=1 Tax=Roseateles amylovorans TaxID=2978473 RepID=A0ABY6ASX4_9BURK|nr:hypothetical protein [Roseateles amylovorans]UXH76331.1 hypothetical protein N4261_14805 [Roseateles amylovorans]